MFNSFVKHPILILLILLLSSKTFAFSNGNIVFFGEIVNTECLVDSESHVKIELYNKDFNQPQTIPISIDLSKCNNGDIFDLSFIESLNEHNKTIGKVELLDRDLKNIPVDGDTVFNNDSDSRVKFNVRYTPVEDEIFSNKVIELEYHWY